MMIYMGTVEISRAAAVTDRVYALDEPWRTRFLQLIASYAQIRPSGGAPTRDDVLGWLGDERLNEQIRLMLRAWTRPNN